MPGPAPRRVLVCEDSKAYAAGLTRFLEHDGGIEVVGVAPSGEQAIAEVERLQPHLLTLDMQLPGIDGLAVVKAVMAASPLPIVILSGHVAKGSERAAEALAAGALEALSKDMLRLDQLDDVWARAMRSRLRRLSSMRVGRRAAKAGRPAPAGAAKPIPRPVRAIGVGASTGGPPAVEAVLRALPPGFPIPVLVVQHMAPGFIEGFAAWLDKKLAVPVGLAVGGQRADAGVWFAPDGAHLRLDRALRFQLDSETGGTHRPSADVLLESLAAGLGREAIGVVLTGMGRDGAAGAAALRRAGGLVVAQDEASSVVFGMPRAVAEDGADLVLAPDQIGPTLAALRPPGERA
jgi:two-component system, chemotaxis family, protein-glutamate methylesterase/glutaminase